VRSTARRCYSSTTDVSKFTRVILEPRKASYDLNEPYSLRGRIIAEDASGVLRDLGAAGVGLHVF
jgi:hypothetical protein